MTQTYPIVLDKKRISEVKRQIKSLFDIIGIKHGEYNIEMFYEKKGHLFCIEINARQGGNGIPYIIEKHCGVNMYKLLVTTSMGDNTYLNEILSNNRKTRYISRHPVFSYSSGIYKGIFISDEIKPFVEQVIELKSIGDFVDECHNATNVVAFIDLVFKNRQQQLKLIKAIEKHIYPLIASKSL